jgi:hypothetical protein
MGGECCSSGKHQVVVVGWSGLPIVAATYHENESYHDIILSCETDGAYNKQRSLQGVNETLCHRNKAL